MPWLGQRDMPLMVLLMWVISCNDWLVMLCNRVLATQISHSLSGLLGSPTSDPDRLSDYINIQICRVSLHAEDLEHNFSSH